MQLPLSFLEKEPSNETNPNPDHVWSSLQNRPRSEALALLARLLAKTVAARVIDQNASPERKE